jgi:Protein of unknown function (DUF3999)
VTKLIAVLLFLVAATPSAEIRYFRYERPLGNIPQTNSQACLVVDPNIFAKAAPGLTDLRLYRDMTETAYVLRTSSSQTPGEQSIKPLNLGRRAGRIVFDAAMPEGSYSDVQLAMKGRDFIATVTVFGSQMQNAPQETRIGSYTIFDFTRQKLGRSTVLHLPDSDFRYLHLSIEGPLAPEDITGLSVTRVSESKPRYVTVAETRVTTQKGHTSQVELSVPPHTPVDRVVFDPGFLPASFSRNVTVSASPLTPPTTDDSEPQPTVFYGNLLRIHRVEGGQRIDEERLNVDAPSADFDGSSKWVVTVENGDDAPIQINAVRLEMLERTLCFDASAGAHYALYYGDPLLKAPEYDYATLFVAQPHPAEVRAGAEEPNPGYEPRPDARPFTEKHPALLWAALIGVVLLLGVIALRTAKQSAGTRA